MPQRQWDTNGGRTPLPVTPDTARRKIRDYVPQMVDYLKAILEEDIKDLSEDGTASVEACEMSCVAIATIVIREEAGQHVKEKYVLNLNYGPEGPTSSLEVELLHGDAPLGNAVPLPLRTRKPLADAINGAKEVILNSSNPNILEPPALTPNSYLEPPPKL
ncbi:unnamed protein product [Urochloa humidicola]